MVVKKLLKRIGNWVINIYLIAFGLAVLWVVGQVFCFASFITPNFTRVSLQLQLLCLNSWL